MTLTDSFGSRFREALRAPEIIAAVGVYDTFSASLVARRGDVLFISGYSFAASFYGLPDIGFIAWSDLVAFVQRVRVVAPDAHIVVDIDDGYADDEVAAHVTRLLGDAGASAVILEDQRRPRRCGHLDGKLLLDLDDHLRRLAVVRAASGDMVVIARTDSSEPADIRARAAAFVAAHADAVLVDGVRDLDTIEELAAELDTPVVFNQLAGGRSQVAGLKELADRGVSLALYSTACLFAAQRALTDSLDQLFAADGRLDGIERTVALGANHGLLEDNLAAVRVRTECA